MKYLPHSSEQPKWLDSRLYAPDPNSSSRFAVIFDYDGCILDGYAFARPTNGYTEIEWHDTECDNSNPLRGKVLYWHQHLKILPLR